MRDLKTRSALNVPVPPWGLAVTSILSVQLGSALSVDLIETVGPPEQPGSGSAWEPSSSWRSPARPCAPFRPGAVLPLLGLGITTGLVTIVFLAAIEHIPLGTAVAIEFLGPLTVAAVRSHSRKVLIWPAVALQGHPGRSSGFRAGRGSIPRKSVYILG